MDLHQLRFSKACSCLTETLLAYVYILNTVLTDFKSLGQTKELAQLIL